MKKFGPGKLCIYSIIDNFVALMQVLVKDATQAHLHILHLCRFCHAQAAFHTVQKNKYHTAQPEFLLVPQILFICVAKKKKKKIGLSVF